MKKSRDQIRQEICDMLDGMELSAKTRGVIADTDFGIIDELFGHCKTIEEVEAIVNEITKDEGE